jgi:hypothetical protein
MGVSPGSREGSSAVADSEGAVGLLALRGGGLVIVGAPLGWAAKGIGAGAEERDCWIASLTFLETAEYALGDGTGCGQGCASGNERFCGMNFAGTFLAARADGEGEDPACDEDCAAGIECE